MIKAHESCRLTAYRCPAGVLTIGWGHTGTDVKPGMVITQAQADRLLVADLATAEAGVNNAVKSLINQHQFDALVSFTFNVGVHAFTGSTLLKLVNANPRDVRIAQEFARWNKAGGRVLAGLTARRLSESKLYYS